MAERLDVAWVVDAPELFIAGVSGLEPKKRSGTIQPLPDGYEPLGPLRMFWRRLVLEKERVVEDCNLRHSFELFCEVAIGVNVLGHAPRKAFADERSDGPP
jgi:hypothetical protein